MRVKVIIGVRGPDRDLQVGEVLEVEDEVARVLGPHVEWVPADFPEPERRGPGRPRRNPRPADHDVSTEVT